MKRSVVLLATFIIESFVVPLVGQQQADQKPPTFEVASIKPNRSGDTIMTYQPRPGGRFTATNSSVRFLMQYAFDVNRSQILEAPSWAVSEHYDIAARAIGNPSVSEMRLIVRQLLEDRFHLSYHWETQTQTVYALVVSKPGMLRPSPPRDCAPLPCHGGLRNSPGHSMGTNMTSGELAASLSFFIQAPVADKTGLEGRYDVDSLDWTPDDADPNGVSLFTAVKEQIGLTLEPSKGPVKMLVIDHVERPTPD